MKNLLLSVFACDPSMGSEDGNGWNWALGLADKGYHVHCLTRSVNQAGIESFPASKNVTFHYIFMPMGTEKLFHAPGPAIYMYYMLWQWLAYKKAKMLHENLKFDLAHHATWGSLQMGSFLYKLNIPFIFGPAGGGQKAPEAFKSYFKGYWASEIKRDKVSNILVKYNPACKDMLKKAHAVLVSNQDTMDMAKSVGAKNCHISFDTALPDNFYPKTLKIKSPQPDKLKLLWVGRFMPRKGVLLVLEVMQRLKDYPGITLTVVGHGEMQQEIEDCIKEYGLENTVRLTGKVPYEQVRGYYESHDVFFFTSLRDSNGVQVMEAMAFGMPLITLNLHGQAAMVSDDNGIRCSVESPAIAISELKEAVLSLYNNPTKVSNMSIEAARFANKQKWPEKIESTVNNYYPF
ncbi:glycosyltransferase family 4 protein [Mucilaginibacter sp.]|uniref:glycosyltransferase family 4 protein n=1 Tax=Mucilaginibacter sp. TaxID=1882438 RepID=UPI002636B626|nr:glycosyltransferase family 4 protein [Mucilaginibacter sp.]